MTGIQNINFLPKLIQLPFFGKTCAMRNKKFSLNAINAYFNMINVSY